MTELQQALIAFFSSSPLREYSVSMLRSVSGLPPILQTIHLLGVAIIMGSAVMLSLRILGIACRRQQLQEMAGRLFPWFLAALPVMLLSGLPFFLARPQRYLTNPIFGYKFVFLFLALAATFLLCYWCREKRMQDGVIIKLVAVLSVSAWIMTAMAGRWIAYVDYIFWPG
jgi:hypothetical protein